jgi:hypothetical protein
MYLGDAWTHKLSCDLVYTGAELRRFEYFGRGVKDRNENRADSSPKVHLNPESIAVRKMFEPSLYAADNERKLLGARCMLRDASGSPASSLIMSDQG